MNRTPRNVNGGIKTIVKKEWEAKQKAIAAEKAAEVRNANKAAMAAMVRGIK